MLSVRRISLRSRFYLVMGLVGLSLLVLAAWSTWTTRHSITTITALFDRQEHSTEQIAVLRESMASLRRYQAEMIAVAVSNPSDVERVHALWRQEITRLREGGQAMARDADPQDPESAALMARQSELLTTVESVINPIATQLGDAKMEASAASAYAQATDQDLDTLQAGLTGVLKAQQARALRAREEIRGSAGFEAGARLLLVGLTLALFLPLMLLTLRSVSGPLDQAVAVADRIAGGDLEGAIDTSGRDETARLMQALARMQAALRDLVGQMRETSLSIELASTEVAAGNADLSQRTEQTAANLQRTAQSVAGLTESVQRSVAAAGTASQQASDAAAVAAQGGAAVAEVVATMGEISASSRRIADIIGVIDGISFQTNILALNAAVEAARAGEQGRGFAVVAGEVRSLAQHAANAAKEIKALIGASAQRIASGSQLVQDTGAQMQTIVSSFHRVKDIIDEISAFSNLQHAGIAELNTAMVELEGMTQQNSALVEQGAASAESLQSQARMLAAVVTRFRITEATG
ncbi:methyl-accepting chemotaxis protein [Xylophilus sp. ASV27]|uniref:methyl-accepting chemotaxis protein n=1 Tax=Xylophilus sp. ASV27 TaxID=2795129 RepID=UPI0018EAD08B|nr:methyl-accepting chemotaxis protein [Xylophilus sp. ASV27]